MTASRKVFKSLCSKPANGSCLLESTLFGKTSHTILLFDSPSSLTVPHSRTSERWLLMGWPSLHDSTCWAFPDFPWQNLIWFARHRIHILLSLPDSGSWVPWTKVTFEATNYHSSNSSSHSLLILPSFSWNLLKLFNAHEWKLFAPGALDW